MKILDYTKQFSFLHISTAQRTQLHQPAPRLGATTL